MSLADAELLPQSDTSLPPSQASALLSSFTNFLTVALHSILYHRNLYPQATFLVSRAYNLPVHQSRHPGVCSWIRDAVAAAGAQVRSGAARQIALAIHLPDSFAVAERWIFDLRSFPAAWGADKDKDAGLGDAATGAGAGAGVGADAQVNWTDVNEALRGALSRIANAGQSRPPLPDGCTFTIGVELRDDASPPIEVCLFGVWHCLFGPPPSPEPHPSKTSPNMSHWNPLGCRIH
jgi:mitotic spindle assembly checkpoint protein MAD2B